ncbi:ABC transporter ATP-binding protein [Selenihalanaerobacter shriftii]|uniref:ABC-type quaternary amine transporter n=1 Tax=Selenihalanaerobacter shriftii TaxID=142842 RepID=A0A1T4JKY4_9FIRM|nr:ABC transporter ATP-binding protein [Selenihalanaerobacter shriftii]SJZ30737.1 molybdate transport system ATP-binding protein [Selenihalanaerobacter shriftii]
MLEVDLYKRLGEFVLDVEFYLDNEILVLFGPSGCGKSTTLELIAGLKTPDRGKVINQGINFFLKEDGKVKENLPINQRRIGYVFQDYSLFPHLTAFENIAYGIHGSDFTKKEIQKKVDELLTELRLKGLANHYPDELSGGQQQRVAIARALIVEPDILLLDEPFSALDTLVREKLRQDLLRIHGEFGIPVIYVTHNLTDVFELADQVAIYNEGKIEQFGAKEEVFYRPRTRNVARFVESKNIFDVVVEECKSEIKLRNDKFNLIAVSNQNFNSGEEVVVVIRPEFIDVLTDIDENVNQRNFYLGVLKKTLSKGAITRLFISIFSEEDYDLIVDTPTDFTNEHRLGAKIGVRLTADYIHIIK